jgi:glucokinase
MVPPVAGACVIGVDVGGTKLLDGAVDADLAVHHRAQRSSQDLGTTELLDVLAEMVREATDAAPGPVLGAGFGIPGALDTRRGVVAACPHLPLEDVRFQALMEERLGIPVVIDNDGNCSMLAEWRHGAALGCDDAVMLTVGTGIGGGIVCNGGLVRGAAGGAAELGHMVVMLDGPPCQGRCPGRGHLEWFASGNAIGRAGVAAAQAHPESALAREAREGREVTGALVTELAHDGDPAARAAIAEVGHALGAGMVTLVNVFNPERIVVGGGAIAAGEVLLGPARLEVAEHAFPGMRELVEIVPARFGADAGLLGAATLAFEEFTE